MLGPEKSEGSALPIIGGGGDHPACPPSFQECLAASQPNTTVLGRSMLILALPKPNKQDV